MLINLRNALMTGKRLPYDAEVEYLESTGTQWIDTGIVATDKTHLQIRFSDFSVAGAWICGARVAFQNGALGAYTESAYGAAVWRIARGSYVSDRFTFNTINTGVSTFDFDGASFTATRTSDATTKTVTATSAAFSSSPNTIHVYTMKQNSGVTARASAKVYACKIWDNGVLVRDFIPVRKGAVGYLYDRVSGRLFGNAGTGDFVLGPDKN